MYEQAYGLSAPPFQLNPDPSFYFESKGHSAAFQYLRFGAFQGEGFVVVTGEIGAGKTTLLRTLLAELDPARVVAAQLVSTQLGADDLLSAVAQAFGINAEGLSKARLLVTLEAYLASLATANRRALLIIDEAQNLDLAAIEELRMLSNFQFGNQALLQSFLVGQPELRRMLSLPQMEQLRQRVIASYHLGPMSEAESAAYIVHRLRRVGWSGRPAFTEDAFAAIHRSCGGLPRRINSLCNRLLLSAYLDGAEAIDAQRVTRVHGELRAEIDGVGTDNGATPRMIGAPLLCVASSSWGLLAVGALLGAFAQREDLPPVKLLRFVADGQVGDERMRQDLRDLGVADTGMAVEIRAKDRPGRIAEVVGALAECLERDAPCAVVVAGDGPFDAMCAVAASQAGVAVVRVDAGLRSGNSSDPQERARAIADHAASLLFVSERVALERLGASGAAEAPAAMVGALAADATRLGLATMEAAERTLRREALPLALLNDPAGFTLIWLEELHPGPAREAVFQVDRELRTLGWRLSLLWALPEAAGSPPVPAADAAVVGLQLLTVRRHAELLGLMRHARCLITDCGWLQDQASALGLPCLTVSATTERQASVLTGSNRLVGPDAAVIARELAELVGHGSGRRGIPEMWDGHAASRIAARLADWLMSRQDDAYRRYLGGA